MAKETVKERLARRREHVKNFVNEQSREGVKIQASIYILSQKLFLSTRQIENDLYYKGQSTPKQSKNKF